MVEHKSEVVREKISDERLQCYLDTYDAGFSLIPARADETKKPGLDRWKGLQSCRFSRKEIIDLYYSDPDPDREPGRNMFLITGDHPWDDSPGVVVAEGDNFDGIAQIRLRCPQTPLYVQSGRGIHFCYRHPGYRIQQILGVVLDGVKYGIDIKSDGNYVVAPGSYHKTGVIYKPSQRITRELIESLPVWQPSWLPHDPKSLPKPEPVDKDDDGVIEECDWDTVEHVTAVKDHALPLSTRISRAKAYLARVPGTKQGEGADNQCFSLAMAISWGFLLPPEEAIKLMAEWGEREDQSDSLGCYYPWSDSEIAHKIHDAVGKTPSQRPGWKLEPTEEDKRNESYMESLIASCKVDELIKDSCELTPKQSGKIDFDAIDKAVESGEVTVCARPSIVVNGRQLREVTDDALNAIRLANRPPQYFTRGAAPVRIDREDNLIKFTPLSQDMMRGIIARAADWFQVTPNKEGKKVFTPKHPPDNVVKDLLSLPPSVLRFPYVDTIVRYPAFTNDGLMTPGYNEESRVWYEPNVSVDVPDRPSPEEVASAVKFIEDNVFHDFPFVSQSDRANCWAAMLSFYVRNLIDGPTPLNIIDAPVEGTGKGKLLSCLIYTATGRWPASFKEAHGDDEWRKLLTTALLEGPDYIFIDNINYALNSGAFAGILTDREHSDRILGGNRRVSLAVKNLWFATGNNVRGSKEIVRRSVRIRLDARCESPSDRKGWRHNLDSWIPENRVALLRACLTICQGWFQAGMPRGAETMGSYENWAAVVGGILSFAGISGFLDNRAVMLAEMNSSDDEWPYFISEWHKQYQDSPVKPSVLLQLAEILGVLSKHYEGNCVRGQQTNWGMAISRQVDRVYNGQQIKFAGIHRKGSKEYKLVPLA